MPALTCSSGPVGTWLPRRESGPLLFWPKRGREGWLASAFAFKPFLEAVPSSPHGRKLAGIRRAQRAESNCPRWPDLRASEPAIRRFERSPRPAEIIALPPIPRQSREITAPALSRAFVNWRVGFRNSITRSLDGIRTFDPLVDSDMGMTCAECRKNSPFLFGTTWHKTSKRQSKDLDVFPVPR